MTAQFSRETWTVGDVLFSLGILTIPFENFSFAPSGGWAAIAPVFFAAYCLWNWRRLPAAFARLQRLVLFAAVIFALTIVNWLRHPPFVAGMIDAIAAMAMGVTFLVALELRFGRHRDPGTMFRLLALSYSLALLLGFEQWLAIHYHWDGVIEFLRDLTRRSVVHRGRVQFGFTEPAFASMHLFGFMLPLLLLFPRHKHARELWFVFGGFIIFAAVTQFSLRVVVDSIVVGTCFLVIRFIKGPNRGLAVAGIVAMAICATFTLSNRAPRAKAMMERGVYADGSAASRWFRIHASAIGWRQDPVSFFTGYGLSNAWVPFRQGYNDARSGYDSMYIEEIEQLRTRHDNSILCMPVRIISEFGFVMFVVIMFLLFDRRYLFLSFLVPYVYLSFDSFAFYTVWLVLFFTKFWRRPA